MRISHLCLLTCLCVGTAHAAPTTAPVVSEPLPEKDGLKVWVSSIELSPSNPHINVVLKNISAKPINIFAENNSEGYSNLSLEIGAVDGEVLSEPLVVSREQRIWKANSI